jgi:hypothetical protein
MSRRIKIDNGKYILLINLHSIPRRNHKKKQKTVVTPHGLGMVEVTHFSLSAFCTF